MWKSACFGVAVLGVSVLASLATACGTVAGVEPGSGDGTAGPGGGAAGGNGSGTFGGDGGATKPPGSGGFCSGSGGIQLPGTDQCTGDLGKKTFVFAMCSCTDLKLSGSIHTSSFDSTRQTSPGHAASVGTNGAFANGGAIGIQGSLWAGGAGVTGDVVSLRGAGSIAQQIWSGGALQAEGSFSVTDDVFVRGPVAGGILDIGGRLHLPSGDPPSQFNVTKGVVHEAVAFGDPCNCKDPLKIDPIVASFKTNNDDAASNVTAATLSKFENIDVTLPCGKYYFDAIQGTNLRLTLTGRTAIFVAGDYDVAGASHLALAVGAELDLFVGGNLKVGGATAFGWSAAPAKVRVYVGGTSVALAGSIGLGANLHAPNAVLTTEASLDVKGSLFARALDVTGAVNVDYDEAIMDLQGCQAPGGGCSSCRDCEGATPACKGGKCGACVVDGDCCAPMVCNAGKCTQTIR